MSDEPTTEELATYIEHEIAAAFWDGGNGADGQQCDFVAKRLRDLQAERDRLPKTADGAIVCLYGSYYVNEGDMTKRLLVGFMWFEWDDDQEVCTYYVTGCDGLTDGLTCPIEHLYSSKQAV